LLGVLGSAFPLVQRLCQKKSRARVPLLGRCEPPAHSFVEVPKNAIASGIQNPEVARRVCITLSGCVLDS